MMVTRALAGAALAAAALTAPANAAQESRNNYVWSVTASVNHTLANRLDATCVFRPERISIDPWRTFVDATTTTTSPSASTSVRCELFYYNYSYGDATYYGYGPATTHSDTFYGVGDRGYVQICVTGTASFNTGWVSTQRVCSRP